jgi:hypothetical protein
MSLSIKSHLQGRIVALFVGFFGGAIAFQMWGSRLHAGDFTLFVMPLCVFGGAFLLPFLFSRIVSAECPKCGSDRAIAGSGKSTIYVCEACGAETNGLGALMGVDLTAMAAKANAQAATLATPAGQAEEKKNRRRFGILFLVGGLAAIALAVVFAQDSIRLAREGVSTDAKVLRVTHERGSQDNGMHHTAFVEYKVGGQAHTLRRSWSTSSGSVWTWPNYHQGEQLRVIYLPSDPARSSIDSAGELFFAPILLTVIGVVFSVFGVAMIRYRPKPDEAPDGTMVLGAQTPQAPEAPQAQAEDNPSQKFIASAISAAVFLAGCGAFYYFTIAKPKMERERMEREAATAVEIAAQARAEAAKRRADSMAAARAAAAKPVEARADMSECQRLLLGQRNDYAAKYPEYSAGFFNIRPPKGGDCKDCLAELTGKLRAWAGFEVVPRGYFTSDYKPGCVAYRQDIFGTAEGAKCVAAFLGSGYSPDQSCQADGFPYTIIHPVR